MAFVNEKRRRAEEPCPSTRRLRLALAVFLLVGLGLFSHAQVSNLAPPPTSKTEPAPPSGAKRDPLGRETPRSAMMGLLRCGALKDYATAAHYLQSTSSDGNLAQIADELQALRPKFKGNPSLLSDDPAGSFDAGLPPNQVRAGVWTVGDLKADVILVRVDDPDVGKIWLVSKETVARIPELYAQMNSERPTLLERITPSALIERHVLTLSLAQWLTWLVSIPLAWGLASLLAFLLSLPRRVWSKLRNLPVITVWNTPVGTPLKCIAAIVIHRLFVDVFDLPLLYRTYYLRFLLALFVACFALLVSRLADRAFDHVVNQTRAQQRGGQSILIMVQRLTQVLILIIAVVCAMALFGLDVKTALAGLGIGGLAIALAAQKSLENIIGGVSMLMDRAVSAGDLCQIGDRIGTVEDIGLRSLKLRTREQSVLVIPNGSLAQMQFENLSTRKKLLIHQRFALRIETNVDQISLVLDRVQSMLDQHPRIERGTSRVRVESLTGAVFEVELFAYGKTGDWSEFTAIRHDVMLKIAEVVYASGTAFAAPTRLMYLSSLANVDSDKANGAVPWIAGVHASDSLRGPDQGFKET